MSVRIAAAHQPATCAAQPPSCAAMLCAQSAVSMAARHSGTCVAVDRSAMHAASAAGAAATAVSLATRGQAEVLLTPQAPKNLRVYGSSSGAVVGLRAARALLDTRRCFTCDGGATCYATPDFTCCGTEASATTYSCRCYDSDSGQHVEAPWSGDFVCDADEARSICDTFGRSTCGTRGVSEDSGLGAFLASLQTLCAHVVAKLLEDCATIMNSFHDGSCEYRLVTLPNVASCALPTVAACAQAYTSGGLACPRCALWRVRSQAHSL